MVCYNICQATLTLQNTVSDQQLGQRSYKCDRQTASTEYDCPENAHRSHRKPLEQVIGEQTDWTENNVEATGQQCERLGVQTQVGQEVVKHESETRNQSEHSRL